MKKLFTYAILPLCALALAYFIFMSITKPVKFNKEVDARKAVAIERLKDIRTLQVAYKSTYNHYAPTMDSLIDFYKNGKINIIKQIGSSDDSLAYEHTKKIKASLGKKATPQYLYELYQKGDKNLVIQIPVPVFVKDTLFNSRANFNIEDLRYIPFTNNEDTVIMATVIKVVSGVDVPLFEAKMPYGQRPAPGQPFKGLLNGLDEQLIINLNATLNDTGRYPGLMVGSIDNANNNAGNWE